MLKTIKIAVKCQLNQAYILDVCPQMTISELSEFLLCSQILHRPVGSFQAKKALGLKSIDNNLLFDYLLMQTKLRLQKLLTFYRYEKKKNKRNLPYLKRQQFQKLEIYGSYDILHIAIFYQQIDDFSHLHKSSGLEYSFLKLYRIESKQQYEYQSLILNKDYFKFNNIITLSEKQGIFYDHKLILKQDLINFNKLQKLLILKNKLIQKYYQYINIFGQLDQIIQTQNNIKFIFKYIPYIKFNQLFHFQYSYHIIQNFITKLLNFIMYFKNQFQGYLYKLYQQKLLSVLFDKIIIDINGHLILNDLNIILQYQHHGKFTQNDIQQLIKEINIYIKLNKSHLYKYQNRIQQDNNSSDYINVLFTFLKIFLIQKNQSKTILIEQYQSKTQLFSWKNVQNINNLPHKKRLTNEETTAKKPKINEKIKIEKKSKFKRQASPNFSFFHDSIKKNRRTKKR